MRHSHFAVDDSRSAGQNVLYPTLIFKIELIQTMSLGFWVPHILTAEYFGT
jgi:hypothetical protein